MYLQVNKLKICRININPIRTYCNTPEKVEKVKAQKQYEPILRYKRPFKRTTNKQIKNNTLIPVYKVLVIGSVFCVLGIGIAYFSFVIFLYYLYR